MFPDSNQGCESGFPDVHLKWLFDGGHTLDSSTEYPLQDGVGECRAVPGYGAEYFQYRVRRQVLLTVGADKNGTPVFVHFSAQAASNSNISEDIM